MLRGTGQHSTPNPQLGNDWVSPERQRFISSRVWLQRPSVRSGSCCSGRCHTSVLIVSRIGLRKYVGAFLHPHLGCSGCPHSCPIMSGVTLRCGPGNGNAMSLRCRILRSPEITRRFLGCTLYRIPLMRCVTSSASITYTCSFRLPAIKWIRHYFTRRTSDFRPISRYISEMVHDLPTTNVPLPRFMKNANRHGDRDIVTIEG